jgi:glyoxylase-like metal-dependent hydrolase (beta-lactamase superfamily II)
MAGQSRELVDPCFLIRHPRGDLIWDAGFPDEIAEMPDGMQIPQLGATIRVPVTLASQLQQVNVAPGEVEFISFSHSHTDHVGNAAMFASAVWIVDPDERTHMFRPEARADAQGFQYVAHLENAETRLIEQDRYDVFGDGSVVIIQTPGHTPGHTILLVRLPNAGNVLLTGDMHHLAESRERRLVPRLNADREQTLQSMALVDRIEAEEEARVVRQHVTEDLRALPRFPEALN